MRPVTTLLTRLRNQLLPAAQGTERADVAHSITATPPRDSAVPKDFSALEDELQIIRKTSAELGRFSWTSDDYQRDLLHFIFENREKGAGVVEVGTYKGGLTAQLALVCTRLGWPLWSLDIDSSFAKLAADLMKRVGLAESVSFHLGGLASFAQAVKLAHPPVLVILDGDHRYQAVMQDIRSVYQLPLQPHAAAFHDYSLRHPTSGERVSEAIADSFGNVPARLIGAQMDGSGPYPTKEKPSADGHWWEVPGSEGAVVELPPRLKG
jgi:predicted O-methyltransferase YrrM